VTRSTAKQTWWLVLAAAIPAGIFAATPTVTGDYGAGVLSGDSPASTIAALLHGHFAAAASAQPFMGLTSVLLRLPAVALGAALGGSQLLRYQLGAFLCAWAAAIVGLVVARQMRRLGAGWLIVGLVAVLMAVSPLTLGNQLSGHPEELLGGALCLAAVLAAIDGRIVAAGVLLGLAIGTKEWTLVAIFPTFLACRRQRWRMLAIAAAVGAPLALTLPLANPAAFARAAHTVGSVRTVNMRSWWWPISVHHSITVREIPGLLLTAYRLPSGWTRTDVSWLALAAALPVSWCFARFRRSDHRYAPLGLLALLLLLRCTLDPLFQSYYVVPLIMVLLAWEGLTRPTRLPVGSLLAITLFWRIESLTVLGQVVAFNLLTTVGLAVYLAIAMLRPLPLTRTSHYRVQLRQLGLKLR
jgi:hypothetical protein